jgi:Tfp pilus assembly protein PilX
MRNTTVYIVTARRAGITAVLAMMYLVVFSTMALGFYVSTTKNSLIAQNDAEASRSLCAAESGLHFMMYQLHSINVPASSADNMLATVYTQLGAKMNGTGNMKATAIEMTGSAIYVPGHGNYITVDTDGSQFRAVITQIAPGQLRVQVRGGHGSMASSRAASSWISI